MFRDLVHPATPLLQRPVALLTAGIIAATAGLTPVAAATATDESGVTTAVRIMAVDAMTGELTVIDPGSGEVVGRFETPSGRMTYLYPSATGRYLMTNHHNGEHITIIDSGLSVEDHGDHSDLVVAPPSVEATVEVGASPGHFWARDGVLATGTDSDGRIIVFDESALDEGEVVTTEFMTSGPDHNTIAALGDALLVGHYSPAGGIDAYSLDGELLQADLVDCGVAHGEARLGDAAVIGCTDGLAFVATDGESFEAEKVPYPETIGAPKRVAFMTWHEDSDVVVGDFGDGLALISADGEDVAIEILPLTAGPTAWPAYDASGETVLVVTDDGSVHAVDPVVGEILWTSPALSVSGEAMFPMATVAASDTAAYVADNGTGEVLELDLASGEITGRFEVGGQPIRVTLTQASGIVD